MTKFMGRVGWAGLGWCWWLPGWAQNPANWMHDAGDESSSMPIEASITLLGALWFFGAKSGPGREFATAHPGLAVLLVFAIPITVGFLVR